jgi:hypothetical protein
MKKGTRLACVVGLASISLVLALAGNASGVKKGKIGDREVGARNLSSNAIHCRALDKFLKGHLCGPGASIKKGGVAGPQGPPGPPGPSGGGGATEVFYVASALADETTIFDDGGVTLKTSCDTSAVLNLELSSTKAGGVLRTAAVGIEDEGDPVETHYSNTTLSSGINAAASASLIFNEALLTLSYVHPDGEVLTGTFQVDDDTNGAFNDTKDCVFAGHMNVS